MKRIVTVLTAAVLGFGALSVASPAAHACATVECRVDCIKRSLESFPRPTVCPD
jgi:hypothetical protein